MTNASLCIYPSGTSASDAHFQAYLLEGLMRWNDDRMEDAVKGAPSFRSYGSALREAVGKLSQSALGRCWDERYRTPGAYTGMKLCPICPGDVS